MRRFLAHHPKVVRRRRQPASEVMLPQSIDDRACDERVRRRCEPASQRDTPSPRIAVIDPPPGRIGDSRERGFDFRPGATPIPTHEQFAVGIRVGAVIKKRNRLVLFEFDRRREKGPQSVKVGLADRVVLVVMALGAAELEAEQRRAHGGRDLVHQHMFPFLLRIDVGHVGAGQAKGGGDFRGRIVRVQGVAGDLQRHKFIVRHIGVDRVDDPVAVLP